MNMVNVNIIAEGDTEEQFIKTVLGPYLSERSVFVYPRLLNGRVSYQRVRKDVINALKANSSWPCTTFFDYYGMIKEDFSLPTNPDSATVALKKQKLEQDFHQDICEAMGGSFNPSRFLPYVSMYEFESLLFSDPTALARALDLTELQLQKLLAIRAQYESPEEINDSRDTAPSKRIIAVKPAYEKSKPRLGLKAAQHVTLDKMLIECPLFAAWVGRLATLSTRA